jgi:hypothetical protein
MPRLDGTGPFGRGSMTGRGMGQCPRFYFQAHGGKWPALTKEQKLELLTKDKEAIEKEIASLEQSK